MATYYATQQVGVADATQIPALKADGRQVNAKESVLIATKDTTNALVANDLVYLGKIPAGSVINGVSVISDTSFGAVTLSVGTAGTPGKYVNAKTMTVTDTPTAIGPNAAALAAGPSSADEDLYLKVSGNVAAAVVATFILRYSSVK